MPHTLHVLASHLDCNQAEAVAVAGRLAAAGLGKGKLAMDRLVADRVAWVALVALVVVEVVATGMAAATAGTVETLEEMAQLRAPTA